MKRNARLFIMSICLLMGAQVMCANGYPSIMDFKPVWTVGASWKIAVHRLTEPALRMNSLNPDVFTPETLALQYVIHIDSLDVFGSDSCFRAQVMLTRIDGDTAVNQGFSTLFLRKQDATLKMVRRYNAQGICEASYEFSAGAVDASDWTGFMPMEVPVFSEDTSAFTPKPGVSESGGVEFIDRDRLFQTVELKDGFIDTLAVTLKKMDDGDVVKEVHQQWVQGKSWWVAAEYFREGQKYAWASLLGD